jgi:hypothetical protein
MISFRSLNLKRHAAWTGAFLVVLTAGVLVVRAQAPTPPYALFQYASLTGSGNTITATQVPVVTATGVTVYENLTLQFNVDANGNLTISPGYPQAIPAPTILTTGFKAGTYAGPSTVLNGGMIISVSGPGVTDGGATEWTLSAGSGANSCTTPDSASWYVGPLANNPLAARLSKAGITSTAYSYGIASSPNCNATTPPQGLNSGNWGYPLIGVSQAGNTLTIVSFSSGATDFSTPQAQITYTLQQ